MTDLAHLRAQACALVGLPLDASDADLFDRTLDWCADQKMPPMVYQIDTGEWLAWVGSFHRERHPTKLGALLLALQAAGRIGGGS